MPETQKPKLGFCLLAGALAGFINGFFGAGGGMVLVPLLLWLVRLEDKAAFSSAVAVILPLCAVSIAVYAVHDSLPLRDALPYLIGGAAGFSDQERGKLDELLAAGFTDSFRCLHPADTGMYSWWSMRFRARERNAGWRIDYFLVSSRLADKIEKAEILMDVMGSDHCPVELDLTL